MSARAGYWFFRPFRARFLAPFAHRSDRRHFTCAVRGCDADRSAAGQVRLGLRASPAASRWRPARRCACASRGPTLYSACCGKLAALLLYRLHLLLTFSQCATGERASGSGRARARERLCVREVQSRNDGS